jgi:hypothetical protein
MAGQINLRPTVVNLLLYAGDGFTIKLACLDNAGTPIDINGSVAAQIRPNRVAPNESPLAEFAVSLVDAYLGIIALSLTSTQTIGLLAANAELFKGVWDVEWTPADKEPRTLVQGSVECIPDVTR